MTHPTLLAGAAIVGLTGARFTAILNSVGGNPYLTAKAKEWFRSVVALSSDPR